MVELSFRAATADDIDGVVALVQSAYRGESSRAGWTTEADLLDGQRTDAGLVRQIVDAEDQLVLLAFDGDELRGCCELRRRDHGAAYFGMFAVDPRLQGGGVGKAILAEAERQAVERWGATRMQMTVLIQREELLAWYVRRGYERTGVMEAFPYDDERYGLPRRPDLLLEVLEKNLQR